ncbi:MAG: trypsin-like peptidase domain-containing protein [Planctomycetota bacterium]|nr:trypsin-like peptidase domain-containing protein [Planctomycetota bacterium]
MADDSTARWTICRTVGWSLLGVCLAASLALVVQSEHNRIVAERAALSAIDATATADNTPTDRVGARSDAKSTPLRQSKPMGPQPSSPSTEQRSSDGRTRKPFRLGPEQAAVRVLLFFDYQCEHCQRIDRDVQALIQRYPAVVSLSVRHFPLCTDCNFSRKANTHPHACHAARAAEAAGLLRGNAGFWQMHAWLFQQGGDFSTDELQATLGQLGYDDTGLFVETMNGKETLQAILADVVEAETRKVAGLPAVFINDARVLGPEAGNAIVQAVQAAVKSSSSSPADPLRSSPTENEESAGIDDFPRPIRNAATEATVRIANPTQSSLGSGVLIGSRGPFAYILTADHIVQQAGSMEFDTFDQAGRLQAGSAVRVAEVLARSARVDLALLRIPNSERLPEVLRVCPPSLIPGAGRFPGLTVGCSGDEAPTAALVTVTEKRLVRRQAGGESAWVWQVDGETAKGRSGGPMVDRRGYVLGVGSGVSDGKGFYCHTAEIHRFLKENGLKWLYEEQPGP